MRVPCVGAVVQDDLGRLLLVQRRNDPSKGRWSIPGGRVEPDEDDGQALRREVLEETGLDVVVGAYLGTVERPGPGGVVFDIRDFACGVMGGRLRAGDDAADVIFVNRRELRDMDAQGLLVDGLMSCLTDWAALPT